MALSKMIFEYSLMLFTFSIFCLFSYIIQIITLIVIVDIGAFPFLSLVSMLSAYFLQSIPVMSKNNFYVYIMYIWLTLLKSSASTEGTLRVIVELDDTDFLDYINCLIFYSAIFYMIGYHSLESLLYINFWLAVFIFGDEILSRFSRNWCRGIIEYLIFHSISLLKMSLSQYLINLGFFSIP